MQNRQKQPAEQQENLWQTYILKADGQDYQADYFCQRMQFSHSLQDNRKQKSRTLSPASSVQAPSCQFGQELLGTGTLLLTAFIEDFLQQFTRTFFIIHIQIG